MGVSTSVYIPFVFTGGGNNAGGENKGDENSGSQSQAPTVSVTGMDVVGERVTAKEIMAWRGEMQRRRAAIAPKQEHL